MESNHDDNNKSENINPLIDIQNQQQDSINKKEESVKENILSGN